MRWRCSLCGCLYTPGAPCCPACRATLHDEEAASPPDATEEDEVAKIDRFGVISTGSVTSEHAPAILPDGAVSPPVSSEAPEGTPPAVAEPASLPSPPKAAAKPAAAPVPPPPAPPAKAVAKATPPPATPPKKAGNG